MFFPPQLGASSGARLLPARGAMLLMFLAVNGGWAGPVELSRQTITLPANAGEPLFADIEGNGRCNLLVIDPVEKRLLNYRQRPDGFSNLPDQAIALPPQTAWVAPCDVEAHPGLELLFSTATGLVYSRQNAGLFESERHTLIETSQAFTGFDFPILTRLSTNTAGTNGLIPVIAAGQAVLYQRNSADEWSPGPPLVLDAEQTAWQIDPASWRDSWALGPNPAHSLNVEQSFRAKPDLKQDKEPENEAVQKIMDDLKQRADAWPPRSVRLDVDGDGREDLVLWQVGFKVDAKTDIYIFLRGTDQKLPERPTQILHCRGFPIPTGSASKVSPVIDLKGDGQCELVLLELKTALISESGLLETALSHGFDWALTIRPFQHGVFSRSPAASVPVRTSLLSEFSLEWPVFIQGDFNGDGRPDLLVRGLGTRWNIFLSTTDGRWFAPQPAMTFDAPGHGYFEINDLNGDGLADIIWHEPAEHRLSIFMSPSRPAKGRNP
jgi:hypothetical protein